jgi:hypothetical protein
MRKPSDINVADLSYISPSQLEQRIHDPYFSDADNDNLLPFTVNVCCAQPDDSEQWKRTSAIWLELEDCINEDADHDSNFTYFTLGGLCHNLPPVVYHSSIHHTLRPLTPGGCLS